MEDTIGGMAMSKNAKTVSNAPVTANYYTLISLSVLSIRNIAI